MEQKGNERNFSRVGFLVIFLSKFSMKTKSQKLTFEISFSKIISTVFFYFTFFGVVDLAAS